MIARNTASVMSRSLGERQRGEYARLKTLSQNTTAVIQMQYNTIKRELQRRDAWRDDARFLDVGCGNGVHTEFWHARGLRACGVDLNPDFINDARARAADQRLSLRYETASADSLPFQDGSFDIVFANSILEHVLDWKSCLDEWVRVLAPGGLLWVETTNVLSPRQGEYRWVPLYSWWPGFLKHLVVKLSRGPLPVLANYSPWPALHWFSYFQLRGILNDRGLSVRDRFDCMDVSRAGWLKRWVRAVALRHDIGRRLAYVLVSPLIVLASKPGVQHQSLAIGMERMANAQPFTTRP